MKNLTTLSLMTTAILILTGCGSNTSGSDTPYNNGVTNYVNTKVEYDSNNDGIIDYDMEMTYNSNCDMTSKHLEAHQGNNFVIPERMTTFTYNSNQQLVTTLIDINNDNSIDDIGTHTYTNGKLTRILWNSGAEHNSTYNSQGRLETFTIAFPGINNIVEKDTYFYNNLGQVIRIETDLDRDNIIDRIVTNIFDNNGNLTVIDMNQINFVNDIVIDMRIINTYNNDNKILTRSTDIGADSSIDSILTASYDSNGNMQMAQEDTDNDGNIDKVEHYTWIVCP